MPAALACAVGACSWLIVGAMPARADDPATITVATGSGPAFGSAFLPVLSFGTPLSIQATSTSGQPVSFAAEDGCSVAAQAGSTSAAVLTVVSTTRVCRLTVASGAGNGQSEATVTYLLRTRMGPQVAPVALVGRKVKVGTSLELGAAGMTTDHGQPVIVVVTNGRKLCTVKARKGVIKVVFGPKEGACTVLASAAGVPDQYLPFQRVYVFKIGAGQGDRGGAASAPESSVMSATMAR